MAFQATISNGFRLFAAIAPLLLGFFLIVSSIFNNDIKGLVYLGGVLIASAINVLLNNLFGNPIPPNTNRPANCNLITWNWGNTLREDVPAYNSMFISFTIAYLLLPMVLTQQYNIMVVLFLFGLLIIDGVTKFYKRCTSILGVFLGSMFGLALGFAWSCLFYYTDHGDLLYFNEILSNKVVCNRPEKQTFKCALYKNGKLIKNL